MSVNILRPTRTDNPAWGCQVDSGLVSVAEHVLYDKRGIPVDIFYGSLGLDQIAAGYQRVNPAVADAAREFLSPQPQYPISGEVAIRYYDINF